MQIQRLAYRRLEKLVVPGMVVIIYGPRRVGKTTLLRQVSAEFPGKMIQFTGDSAIDREKLELNDQRHLQNVLGNAEYVLIDEAQRIPNIGLSLKLITDYMPDKAVVVTGSATFELAHQTEEPLTGRKRTLVLYPISYPEIESFRGIVETKLALERWLVWGSYPQAVTIDDDDERRLFLEELVDGYLYRDMLEIAGVKHPGKIVDLLRLLAHQIGNEVSLSELGQNLGMTHETVDRYLDLLQKNFVLINVRGLARNLRKEISKTSRYYFWDNGVRNALIRSFNGLRLRNDVGQLWENFLVVERLKHMTNTGKTVNYYFWRTHDQKELDWIEESDGVLNGFEFKYADGVIRKAVSGDFVGAYPKSHLQVVNKDNFEGFVKE